MYFLSFFGFILNDEDKSQNHIYITYTFVFNTATESSGRPLSKYHLKLKYIRILPLSALPKNSFLFKMMFCFIMIRYQKDQLIIYTLE